MSDVAIEIGDVWVRKNDRRSWVTVERIDETDGLYVRREQSQRRQWIKERTLRASYTLHRRTPAATPEGGEDRG
jgi:hypothetical protein